MPKFQSIAVGALIMAAAAGSAVAGPLVTFTYTNLNGIYNDNGNGTGNFNALAANAGGLRTDGSVSRVVGPGAGTAVFNRAFSAVLPRISC